MFSFFTFSVCHSNSVPIRYDVMKKCWRMVPTERPSFSALVQSLGKILAAVADYVELSMTLQQESDDYDKMRPLSASGTYVGHESILIIHVLCYCSRHTAGAEVAEEPNPVGPDSSEATSSRPNPVHGGSPTYETGPATTSSPTDE